MDHFDPTLKNQRIQVHQRDFVPFLDREMIGQRVREMGAEIAEKYAGKVPLFLSVLNGAFVFAADLVRACSLDCEVAFIRLSSYRGIQSTGDILTVLGLDIDIAARPVIIIEDIIDTGRTMHRLLGDLRAKDPESLAIAALLFKPEALEIPLDIDFLGFEIPNKFVLGYGLDYDGIGRNLPDIYQLSE